MNDFRPDSLSTLPDARRLVVKIGSSSLTRPDGGFNLNRVDQVAGQLSRLVDQGKEVTLVSSGAIAAGRSSLGLSRRPSDLAEAQACAALGQGLLLAHWREAFTAHRRHVAQVLLTLDDVTRRRSYVNAHAALEKLLSFGVIPVVNENDTVATDEIRFGDNDRLAALTAELIGADALILLTDVDGLYTAPPGEAGATLIETVTEPGEIERLEIGETGTDFGTGGMVTKVSAATQAASSGIPAVLTNADNLAGVLSGKGPATFFKAAPRRRAARPNWLANAAQAVGELVVDDGAAQAIIHGGHSLLAAGIVQVNGSFMTGDVVRVTYCGAELARGQVAYDAGYLGTIAGKKSSQINPADPHCVRPAIHRDDLVLTTNL